ncbi:kinase-like protein [Amanita rubescens]|nr:kinase-like protein [Amanita rubescens]
MASHALLLRLFLSPSFFSVHVALHYLLIYADNIGITYYLTRRLRELDTRELRDVWGFICHLLVTRPSKSRALECFVVDIARRSTHIAMFTLWFMQASLKDLSTSRYDSHSFIICQRVLHKCHEIIFGDLPSSAVSPYSTIKPHPEPALIGLGMVLAGAPGMPVLTEIMGEVAIEQGRIDEDGNNLRSLEQDDEVAGALISEPEANEETREGDDQDTGTVIRRRTISAAQTVPALPLHLRLVRKSRASEDPLGQSDSEQVSTLFQSSPSIATRMPLRSAAISQADSLLEKYDLASQMQLLRSHYCRSEVQFILNLESISNRLLIVPRPARVSALRAELTAMNHKLPAEVCMPMWCTSSDAPRGNRNSEPHHRIVRIPPGESVVLNSAERAPYLLLIEILHDDLDFEPNKRSNKEVLKRIVIKEEERKGASKELIPFTSAPSRHKHQPNINDYDVGEQSDTKQPTTPLNNSSASAGPEDEEEMDLVEQLYGSSPSLKVCQVDLSDSILDMATWSRSYSPNPETNLPTPQLPRSTEDILPRTNRSDHILSLDEYSERMKTAAIMLAQLNASLVRESVTSISLQGASGVSSEPAGTTKGISIPKLKGAEQPQSAAVRMKLQYSEAAAIRARIMNEMLALEEERMERMRDHGEDEQLMGLGDVSGSMKSAEDEHIIRRELNKADPSAVIFSESWTAKKSRIRHSSPYGHLANWDCVSVIVKTGGDLRQEQLAVQLIQEFQRIWEDEKCGCWVRHFNILITGGTSGLVETITDAVSVHSIKKAEYARRLAEGTFRHITLLDHFKSTYGDISSAKFVRAQRNFAKSLAGYSIIAYLLQIKDRHNGNILLDREGHLIHIDFGFMLSNTPGNIGFEAAPFKFPFEYLEVLGGTGSAPYLEFRRLFREGFEAARKHCDRIINSALPCFAAFGEQTAGYLRDRFQPTLTHALVGEYIDRLIDTSLGSHWTRLYDSFQYYSQSIL